MGSFNPDWLINVEDKGPKLSERLVRKLAPRLARKADEIDRKAEHTFQYARGIENRLERLFEYLGLTEEWQPDVVIRKQAKRKK